LESDANSKGKTKNIEEVKKSVKKQFPEEFDNSSQEQSDEAGQQICIEINKNSVIKIKNINQSKKKLNVKRQIQKSQITIVQNGSVSSIKFKTIEPELETESECELDSKPLNNTLRLNTADFSLRSSKETQSKLKNTFP